MALIALGTPEPGRRPSQLGQLTSPAYVGGGNVFPATSICVLPIQLDVVLPSVPWCWFFYPFWVFPAP